jgi:hypothetical protein
MKLITIQEITDKDYHPLPGSKAFEMARAWSHWARLARARGDVVPGHN